MGSNERRSLAAWLRARNADPHAFAWQAWCRLRGRSCCNVVRIAAPAVAVCSCGRALPCERAGEHGLVPVVIVGIVGVIAGGFVLGIDPVVDFAKAVVDGLALVADAAISLLPDAGDLGLDAQTGWLWAYAYFNAFLPLSEVLGFIAIIIGIKLAIFAWRMADRIYHLIPKPLSGT